MSSSSNAGNVSDAGSAAAAAKPVFVPLPPRSQRDQREIRRQLDAIPVGTYVSEVIGIPVVVTRHSEGRWSIDTFDYARGLDLDMAVRRIQGL